MDKELGWSKELPSSIGEYLMRDESGGPTLYEFIYIGGELCCGPKSRKLRVEAGTGMLKSCEWKVIDIRPGI